jgi:hypothetical protein
MRAWLSDGLALLLIFAMLAVVSAGFWLLR